MAVEYPNRVNPKLGTKVVEGFLVGRDKTVVPPNEVEHLASLGCTDKDIAEYFGVSESSLRYNLSVFLIKGRHQLKVSLRQKQLQVALEGNPTMLIWLGRNVLGQNETPINNDDNKVLPFTDDELDEIKDNLEEELNDLDAAE